MATVNISSVAGSTLTWATSPFTWGSNSFTWATANAGDAFTATVTEDTVAFAELVKNSPTKKNLDTVAFTELGKKGIARIGKETLSILENYTDVVHFNPKFIVTLSVAEKLLKTLQYHIYENVGIAELYVDYILFFIRAVENIFVSEALTNNTILTKKEVFTASEFTKRTINKKSLETTSFAELLKKNQSCISKQSVVLLEGNGRSTGIFKKETVLISDKELNAFVKKVLSNLNFSETYTDNILFMIRAMESILFTETPKKTTAIPKSEVFAITDKGIKSAGKVNKETLHTTDGNTIDRDVSYHRVLTEAVHLVDKVAKHLSFTREEAMNLMTDILRRANATISDIVISTGDMTLEEFSALSTPAGFEEFKDFLSGELNYKDALVKVIMEAGITSGRPLITEWKLNVDVPDVVDKGTADLTAGTTTRVNFNRSFYEPPEVNVTLKGGTVIASPRITNITTTYFDVELIGTGGTQIAGTISWTSLGAGGAII